jgi:hypothetical protein
LNAPAEEHFVKLLKSWDIQVEHTDQIGDFVIKFPQVIPHAPGHLGSNFLRYLYCAGAKDQAGDHKFLDCLQMGVSLHSIDTNAVWVCTEFLKFCKKSDPMPTSTLAIPVEVGHRWNHFILRPI